MAAVEAAASREPELRRAAAVAAARVEAVVAARAAVDAPWQLLLPRWQNGEVRVAAALAMGSAAGASARAVCLPEGGLPSV